MNIRSLFLLGLLSCVAQAFTAIEGTAALVDESCITHQDVLQKVSEIKSQLSGAELPSDQELQAQALDFLIQETAILNEAKERNIRIQDQDIASAISHPETLTPSEKEAIRKQMTVMTLQNALMHQKNVFPSKDAIEHLARKQAEAQTQYTLTDYQTPNFASALRIKEALKKHQAPLAGKTKQYHQRHTHDFPDAFAQALMHRSKQDTILGPIQTGNGFHVLSIEHVQNKPPSMQHAFEILRQKALQAFWPKWVAQTLKHHYIQKFPNVT